jgi:hypothetical protein
VSPYGSDRRGAPRRYVYVATLELLALRRALREMLDPDGQLTDTAYASTVAGLQSLLRKLGETP